VFAKGDRVAWSHSYATEHAAGSIVRAEVVEAKAPDAKLGTVKGVANDEGTYFEVLIDGDKDTTVLTEDELVKVAD
jgi:hypothetical protein